MSRYFAELDDRFADGFDVAGALDDAGHAYNPPHGAFLLAGAGSSGADRSSGADAPGPDAAGTDDAPLACGAVTWLDLERGEVKRMWVAPAARGRGLASALLSALEDEVRGAGRTVVVLDTRSVLVEAVALYPRRGYQTVERYNDNPYADRWFRKTLR